VLIPRSGPEVFVTGGGPAGLAAAIAARRRGFSVILADSAEPPIDKACGEGLMPSTQAALHQLGIELPSDVGFRFRGIQFVHDGTSVSADFPVRDGMGIRRTLLHELLLRQAEKSGVRMLWRTTVTGICAGSVHLKNHVVSPRWIIGADGSHSRVRPWTRLDSVSTMSRRFATRKHYRVRPWSQFMEIHWGPRLQAYVTPVSGSEVCVVIMAHNSHDANFDYAMQTLPVLRARLVDAELSGSQRGALTMIQSLPRVWRGNVALVGDASGGVDAITGEGLRLAFQQAIALARVMESGDLREYGAVHRRLARRSVRIARLMLQLGNCPRLRSRVIAALNRNPRLFARLLAIHVGQPPPLQFLGTGARLTWELFAS